MKWDIDIALEISHGRHRVFSLRRWVPLFQAWHIEHKNRARSCYSKTRFPNEQSALNTGWFKQHPVKHSAYQCDLCDGWHLTTQ